MYFYCYSIKLKDFLKMNGLRYEVRRKHPNGNYYWTFKKSKVLDDALAGWDEYKEYFG